MPAARRPPLHPLTLVRRGMLATLSLAAGAALGWLVGQHLWVLGQLARADVRGSLATAPAAGRRGGAARGGRLLAERETSAWRLRHTVEDGIERIVYTPHERRFETPLLLQHGMWHGAWCWELWQGQLAEWGWESHAVSLPGHGASPIQRPIALCTLDYYLGFLKAEVERLPRPPVLVAHSMGGALAQWYLKYAGDLPAAVLVAPWPSHSTLLDGLPRFVRLDPLMVPLMSLAWSAAPMVRSPERAARLLLGSRALITPEGLFARLGPESALVTYQHNPPFWQPPERAATPLLWLAGECDAAIGLEAERRSALHYGAEFHVISDAGHNLMLEADYAVSARLVHDWLVARTIT